ncbi:MAG: hypothetical protein ACKV2T_11995 [Kofleriaceae bacterium]
MKPLISCVVAVAIASCGPPTRDLDIDGDTPADAAPPWGARLSGKVWGPGHVFPIAGALVAAYAEPPPAIPAGAYCARCVQAPGGESSAISAADGTFTLQLPVESTVYLVVQKGEFRRVTEYTAPPQIGDTTIDEALTTLPNRTNAAAGTTIPNIALVYGDYDGVQDILGKVGIGAVDSGYGFAWGSETGIFDVYDNHGDSSTPARGAALDSLLLDPARMSRYHMIAFACSNNSRFGFMTNPTIQSNLRAYVRGGGKLYISDYAFPVLERVWPEFVWFTDPLHGGCNETMSPPNCNHGPPFDSPSRSLDSDTSAWLLAVDPTVTGTTSQAELTTYENWNTIGQVAPGYVGDDQNGAPITMPPKVWVEGGWNYAPDEAPPTFDRTTPHPLTVSFPFGCGRVMYTTYHTVGSTTNKHPGLLTQELLLFQLVLELSRCSGEGLL